MTQVPNDPKIYHIVHVNNLPSIIADGYIWSHAKAITQGIAYTEIGMSRIKSRRLSMPVRSHPGLMVGACVPFYFCARSVMLYTLAGNHPELAYKGGDEPIVHLELSMRKVIAWAEQSNHRWAFTTSTAAAYHFNDYVKIEDLTKIDWTAVNARYWPECSEQKQAEFLLEEKLPWELVQTIGVKSKWALARVADVLPENANRPHVSLKPEWYY